MNPRAKSTKPTEVGYSPLQRALILMRVLGLAMWMGRSDKAIDLQTYPYDQFLDAWQDDGTKKIDDYLAVVSQLP